MRFVETLKYYFVHQALVHGKRFPILALRADFVLLRDQNVMEFGTGCVKICSSVSSRF